jgi:hypothetical protein
MKYVSKILLCILVTKAATVSAQNNNSPYSLLGIGDVETSTFDRSTGMAGAGLSLFSGRSMYHGNPASYVNLDDHFFSVELSGRFKANSYRGARIDAATEGSADMQMGKLALGIKVKPWWGSSVGLMPYSNSSYSFYGLKEVEGSGGSQNLNAYYKGSGGLRKAYFANAFRLNKNFTVGLEAAFLFGSLTREEILSTASINGSTITTTEDNYMRNGQFKLGAQYSGKLSKKWRIGLGATASNKTSLSTDNYLTVVAGTTPVITDKVTSTGSFDLPVSYAAGVSFNYDRKFTVAVDYQRQNWSNLNYKGLSYKLLNSDRLAAGFEFSHLVRNTYFERFYLQGGAFMGKSYLQMYGEQLKNYGGTVGLGMNSKSAQLSYQISLEMGVNGTTKQNLIRQNYSQVNFTVIYRDFWFTKVKKYD